MFQYGINIFHLKWIFLLCLVYLINKAHLAYRRYKLYKKWNCSPILCHNKSIIEEIKDALEIIKVKNEGRFSEFTKNKFIENKAHTLCSSVIGRTVILSKNPEIIKSVVASQFDNFSIGNRPKCFFPLLGNGIFASEGERWKHSRTMLKPQFMRDQIVRVKYLESHMQLFFKIVRRYKAKSFDIQSLFHYLTLDASTEFLFGESLGSLSSYYYGEKSKTSELQEGFEKAFNTSQEFLMLRLLAQDFYFLVDNRKFREANRKVRTFAEYYVNKVLELKSEQLEANSQEQYIFLNELAKETKNTKVLQDETLSIMLAGRNTTASLLSFLFFELSKNQDIWEKLKNEVYITFGKGNNVDFDSITFESMKRCTYLKWVINEALRMYPPVHSNMRVAKNDLVLPKGGGVNQEDPILVKKGSTLMLSIYSCHRAKEYYGDDSDEFRPERWGSLKNIGWAYMPFSSGPRICLGQQFALAEASYITIRIAQEFPNLISHNLTYPPKLISNATIRLMDGCNVSLY